MKNGKKEKSEKPHDWNGVGEIQACQVEIVQGGGRKDGKEGRERERRQEGGRSAQAGIKKLGCKSVHGNYATGVKREERGHWQHISNSDGTKAIKISEKRRKERKTANCERRCRRRSHNDALATPGILLVLHLAFLLLLLLSLRGTVGLWIHQPRIRRGI